MNKKKRFAGANPRGARPGRSRAPPAPRPCRPAPAYPAGSGSQPAAAPGRTRTLSRDQRYRQLSVRRLMTMLQRVLLRQMQWVVFEPNNRSLWSEIRHLLENFLRQLFIAGAFKGRNEQEAFFVRCDGELNNKQVLDAGKLIVEIGVAPAEPLEFIVVRIVRGGDGTLAVES